MSILGHLEPTNVFRFFEEICNIPHGSGTLTKSVIIWWISLKIEIWNIIRMKSRMLSL